MKTTISLLAISIIASLLMISAGNDRIPPQPLPFPQPAGWPAPNPNLYAKNKPTVQGFELGKKLFYDGRLSSDGEISCGSCHQQFGAFATYDHDLSHGVTNALTTRNAPVLVNLAWMREFHWDGGVNHLEVQPLHPLTAPNEMGSSLDSVIRILKNDTAYIRMFKAAFGDGTINSQRMLKALAQFTGFLVSANSRYDRMKRGELVFKEYEKRGYEVYRMHCSGCHPEPLFTSHEYLSNGLSLNRFKDAGRMGISGQRVDSLKFKVPTLRNVQVSFPYMHDGRHYTLYQVIEHYRNGIDSTRTDADPRLKKNIPLTTRDRNDLVYFLYTLTDSSFLKDPRFSPSGMVGEAVPDIHKMNAP